MVIDFDPASVAIATNTYYPTWYRGKLRSIKHTEKIRGDLAFEFYRKALNLGYSVVAADGFSSKSFRQELLKLRGLKVIVRKSPKRAPSKRQAIKAASKIFGVKFIVMTEPEKISLIENCIPQMVEPLLKSAADMVVPKREEKLFRSTYPEFQYQSEAEANELYNHLLISFGLMAAGVEFDMFFGPRVIKNDKKIISLFMRKFIFKSNQSLYEYFDPEEFSNVIFFPVVEALKKGLRVESIVVPFAYPVLQKKNEESGEKELFFEKRKSQRMGILIDLMHFLSYLEKNPASRLRRKK